MADEPIEALGGKTPMQYADTPYMDKLAEMGVTGRMKTVADGFHPGSEVANMAVPVSYTHLILFCYRVAHITLGAFECEFFVQYSNCQVCICIPDGKCRIVFRAGL